MIHLIPEWEEHRHIHSAECPCSPDVYLATYCDEVTGIPTNRKIPLAYHNHYEPRPNQVNDPSNAESGRQ